MCRRPEGRHTGEVSVDTKKTFEKEKGKYRVGRYMWEGGRRERGENNIKNEITARPDKHTLTGDTAKE